MVNIKLALKVIVIWVIFSVWIKYYSYYEASPVQNLGNDRDKLIALRHAIKLYMKEQKATPLNLRHLSIFSQAHDQGLSIYDSTGYRFDYTPLDLKHWLLRSFGTEGVENSMSSGKNIYICSQDIYRIKGRSYADNKIVPDSVSGSVAPNGSWVAKIYQHPTLNSKKLLLKEVKGRKRVMMAYHDRVDEFLWIDEGQRVVYSASGSSSYSDGIYIWDLRTQKHRNILKLIKGGKSGFYPGGKNRGWLNKIHAYDPKKEELYFFAAPNNQDYFPLGDFIDKKNYYSAFIPLPSPSSWKNTYAALSRPQRMLAIRSLIDAQPLCHNGSKSQRQWCKLPRKGALEDVLLAWQNYVEQSYNSEMLPFALWGLAFLYDDAVVAWGQHVKRQRSGASEQQIQTAGVLRSYATELASIAMEHPMASNLQKSTAKALWMDLSDGYTQNNKLVDFNINSPKLKLD